MRVLVTPVFIDESRVLSKSNSHSNIEASLIEEVLLVDIDTICHTGSPKKLGGSNLTPLIRKRIANNTGKSSGFRLYLWTFIKDEDVYLMFIHPKTGRRSSANISKETQIKLVKEFIEFKKTGQCEQIEYSKSNNKILFTKSGKPLFN